MPRASQWHTCQFPLLGLYTVHVTGLNVIRDVKEVKINLQSETIKSQIAYCRLHPRCHILTNSTKHCSYLTSNWYCHLANSNVLLDSAVWFENMTSPTKPEVYTYRNAVRGDRARASGTGNMHKIGEVRSCRFRVMRADRQTNRQTYSSQYFAPLQKRSNNV